MRAVGVAIVSLLFGVSCNKSSQGEPAPAGSAGEGPQPKAPAPAFSAGTTTAAAASAQLAGSVAPAATVAAVSSVAPTPAGAEASSTDYSWLADPELEPKPAGTLASRIPPPPGYQRVTLEPGSFGAWLRGLPLAPEGTPVKSFDGAEVHPGDDDYVAAVIAIDVGKQDLQQSSDVIVRLHAEWLWSKKALDAMSYKASTKLDLPIARWQKGQRLIANGPNVFWAVKTKPAELGYKDFREFLAQVFAWGNSTSLALGTELVDDPAKLSPGDFFLQGGTGLCAIVLDLAQKPTGERVALLGQGLNPAQSPHLLRPGRGTAWFSVRPPLSVMTPYSGEFAWGELRRFPVPAPKTAPEAQ